ncbi:hypothetical protein FCH28_24375 [Streptomyces piniterrae]|uniref:LysM domain-containing protein n=1 Tax=Streptomyces piniterrae TaxID=2571125 RepID=A0A4U0N6U3_9ACTN|nr:peptidoglycan-binding protein [Streptomyces piniterrae]TJZ49455.1 hypothetical protein FCH28_24375 [Streptomyces piniterrae]
MLFARRADWKATKPDNLHEPVTSTKGVKVHYTGTRFEPFLEVHALCAMRVKEIQREHMEGKGDSEIDYNLLVCRHGVVFEGRGWREQNAANGNRELNRAHHAVCAPTGSGGYTDVPEKMVRGIQDAIAYLRRHGAGWEIAGHRDGYATQCPGDLLYGHVLNGSLDPGVLWDGGNHIVRGGETLGRISVRYNVPSDYIILANPDDLDASGKVKDGMKLWIPARGVPLKGADPTPGDDATEFQPFPGAKWFHEEPSSPIITAMGERLVAEGCSEYAKGPGPQWSEADRASYAKWQRKLGYAGAKADGWPGETSWEQLRVPYVGQKPGDFEEFPGDAWFHDQPKSRIITAMGKRLVEEGCGHYSKGPGPQWTEADRHSYAVWQRKLGFNGSKADGWPGEYSWDRLQVPEDDD